MRTCRKRLKKKSYFDPRSFRHGPTSKKNGRRRVLIGCKKGYWDDRRGRCRIGTEAYEVFVTTSKKRCPAGYHNKR